MKKTWGFCCGLAVMNLNRSHENEGSIPGLTQWVKDPVLPWLWCRSQTHLLHCSGCGWASSCCSNSTLAWELYTADAALKKKKRKEEEDLNPIICLYNWTWDHIWLFEVLMELSPLFCWLLFHNTYMNICSILKGSINQHSNHPKKAIKTKVHLSLIEE